MSESGEKLRLGGMALANGLLLHGPSHWAAAVRTRDGELVVASGVKPRITAVDRVPGLRGVVRLAEAMVILPIVRARLPQARLSFERPGVIAAAAAATGAATLARRRLGAFAGEASAALAGLVPAIMALRIGEVAKWHGVEHKAVAAYEQDSDAAEAAKEHDRCGSNLVAPLLVANVAGAWLARKTLEQPGPLANAAVGLGSMAIAVEVFAWSERHADTAIAQALRRPGYEIQRIVGTREPDESQLEVGRAAMAELLELEAA
jgi:uncharacterized protein YqhQ